MASAERHFWKPRKFPPRCASRPAFPDPETEQDIIDHNRFHSKGIVDTRNILAAALRKSHDTPIIIGGYYAGPTVGVPSHRATGYQLQSGEFDFLTSVLGYFAPRLSGGPGKAHQALGVHFCCTTLSD